MHEPLIPASLFERVQDIKAGKAGKKVTRHNHTYRGLFRCGLCDGPMSPERQKGRVYYRCQARECATKCVREDVLETQIAGVLSRVTITKRDIKRLIAEFTAWWETRADSNETKTASLQLDALAARQERLTDALVDRLIDKETFNARNQKLLLDKARLEEEIAEAENKDADPERLRNFLELIKNLAVTYIYGEPDEKREIAQMAISNRTVVGKNVLVEPSDWLVAAETAIAGLIGAPDRDTLRSSPDMQDPKIRSSCALDRDTPRSSPDMQDSKIRSSCAPDRPTSRRRPELLGEHVTAMRKLMRFSDRSFMAPTLKQYSDLPTRPNRLISTKNCPNHRVDSI